MLTLNYSITKEDYIHCYTYLMWDAPGKRKKHLLYYGQQVLLNGAIIFILLYSGLLDNRPSMKYIYIGILSFIVILQIASGRAKIKRQADKIAEDPDNAPIFNELEVQVAETGMLVKDATKETRYNWNAFIHKLENEEYYLLSTTKINIVIVPKRAFKNTAEKEQFDHLLGTHLSFDAEIAHLIPKS